VRPFFFGDSAEPLFGLYHPPRGPRSHRCSVVVCNPFGQEYLRAHRSLQQLAGRLAASGFHTLRFDYFGCGDSGGDDHQGGLGRWLEDTAAAVEEVQALSESPTVALVGLRMGATLAVRLASRCPVVEHLVLWDPVPNGRRYLEELTIAHEVWIREHTHPRLGGQAAPVEAQALGFPLPSGLRAELEAVDLSNFPRSPARHALVLTTPGRDAEAVLFPEGAVPGGGVERTSVRGSPVWLRGDGMDSSLVPLAALEHIATWLSRRCA
jgi:alpha/beta superfamily hydrolase